MNSPRFVFGHRTALVAIAGGLLLSGCYYGYPPYPGGYYSPTVPVAYTQREFSLPPGTAGAPGASAPATASGVTYSTAPVQYQYATAAPTADYYGDYYATPSYAYYPPYPAYAAYPYPAYYGYPSVAIGFGYWGGGGCCWGLGYGYHGYGYHGYNGWHGGGYGGYGGWHGGGTGWQGGGGWHGGGGRSH
jgi:hypothetical protein